MNDDQLISEYLRRKPTIFNSRSLVSQIADENGLSVPSVRAALQKAKVYIAKPLDIGAVSERDRMAIEERLSHFSVPAGQRKLDAQAKFHEEIARETGYSRWAIDECARFNKHRTNAESSPQNMPDQKKGPDLLGWLFLIGISLAVATCIQTSDPDEGKSELQKKCEETLGPSGFDCS